MSDGASFRYYKPSTLFDLCVYHAVRGTTYLSALRNLNLRIEGGHRVPRRGPVLVVANHVSDLDPPLISLIAHRQMIYVAKKELWDHPVKGWLMTRFGSIPIDRTGADRRALTWAIEALHGGEAVIIFPEGARSRSGELMAPKAGAGMIWAKTRVPMLPVYIEGTYEARPIGATRTQPSKVRIVVGTPMGFPSDFPLDRGGSEAYSLLSRFMMNRIAALKARLSD